MTSYLKPREELRSGNLCRGEQFEKKEKSRFLNMFDDDDDEEPEQPITMLDDLKHLSGNYSDPE